MKTISTVVLLCLSLLALQACQQQAQPDKTTLDNATEKLSYALGIEFGAKMKELKTDIDFASLVQGIKDTLASGKSLIENTEVAGILLEFKKTEGEKFLEANKDKEGVTTTASGLQYKVLKEGSGATPKSTDNVTVHYRGTLVDGREFDSSYKRNQPTSFPLNRVIPGWTEGLQLMNMGSKYEFYIPSELGYGKRGAPGSIIGPDAVLVFEVELLKIN